jgi:uncharacterized protein HemX
MSSVGLASDTVAAIVLGILQLGIGLVSLWQQRQLRQAYRAYVQRLGNGDTLTWARGEKRRKKIYNLRAQLSTSKVCRDTSKLTTVPMVTSRSGYLPTKTASDGSIFLV